MYTLELQFNDHTFNRTYGIFTTLEKAQSFVKDALGFDVTWSNPKNTVKGTSFSSDLVVPVTTIANRRGSFYIDRLPVDPAEYSTDLRYGLVD